MFVFKPINLQDVSIIETKVHKEQSLTSGSSGVTSVQYRSGSKREGSESYTESGSHWHTLHLLFYQSGSQLRKESGEEKKFNEPMATLASNERTNNPQLIKKFHSSGSVISIPQQTFGERIRPKSLTITDTSTAVEVTIKDDGHGNLYPVGNSISQSTLSPSSSANYVGNIFYNSGIVAITDTGSYSSSINYTDVGSSAFKLDFQSEQTIYTHEYTVRIEPSDFTHTMNVTARTFLENDERYNVHSETPYLKADTTGSEWKPYFNQIQLYSKTEKVLHAPADLFPLNAINARMRKLYEPVIVANLPRPIQMRDDMSMTFKIRLDI